MLSHHLVSRKRVFGSLLMAGHIIKEEKPLGITIDIDCAINLSEQRIAIKPSIAILAGFKCDPGLTKLSGLSIGSLKIRSKTYFSPSRKGPHKAPIQMSKNRRP
jgi:hypothetical protein